MLAFIRGESTFVGPGQIYVKILPDGEPLQLTHDALAKMSPKFSPDGARIAYTTEDGSGWNTWIVPVLGGQPRLFLANAEGLTWIAAEAGQPRILFSEMTGRGQQMGIVTSTESRTEHRTVYMPPEESGMAHRSYLSPDGRQVLVVEMKFSRWLPCRLVPFDGSTAGKPVGPAPAQCTDAAWSRDGKWMYFSANSGNGYHTWRQRFPDGKPEQVTSGATEEEGIEFAPDGRSFVTSIGTSQSTLWIHDSRGDRQITSEGFAIFPSLSPDARRLYYLLRAGGGMSIVSGEFWVADLESGQRQRLLPDFLMRHYTISADGERVVFVAAADAGRSPVWLAALNRRSSPRQVTAGDARKAFFGPGGDVLFLGQEKGDNHLFRVQADGSESPRLMATPRFRGERMFLAANGLSVSSDGNWVVEASPTEDLPAAVVVYPTDGGPPTLICETCARYNSFERGPQPPFVSWSPDGRFFYLNFQGSIYAIPLRPGQALPPLPASGFRSMEEVTALPGAQLITEEAFPGLNPSVYAFTKFAIQRNIYRVAVP
jgi:Tol biopolymer transport system component